MFRSMTCLGSSTRHHYQSLLQPKSLIPHHTLRRLPKMPGDCLDKSILSRLEQLHKSADIAHNFKHITIVASEVSKAMTAEKYDFLKPWQKNALLAAAYLHEVDDEKLKIELPGVPKEGKLPNAKALLEEYSQTEEFRSLALEVIGLVSTRTNHNREIAPDEKWKLLVRDADRGQALGKVGIARCYAYTINDNKPLFTPETPRCQTLEELWKVATPQRFAAYKGISVSMIDHYLDKLLHINIASSGDEYLKGRMEEGHGEMVDFVLEFGKTGTVDIPYLEGLVKEYC